jgi:hypothetical protein
VPNNFINQFHYLYTAVSLLLCSLIKKKNMKRVLKISFFAISAILLTACAVKDADTKHQSIESADYNFIVANDLGRNGYYDQKPIAATMGLLADDIDVEFVAAAGDVHHFEGVASTSDPLWMTNFELIYDHPSLMLDWYAILGNHEYRGNTQACLDYSKVSRRWIMPNRYYTLVKEVDDSTTLRLLFIDTAPLIDKYRKDSDTYPDALIVSVPNSIPSNVTNKIYLINTKGDTIRYPFKVDVPSPLISSMYCEYVDDGDTAIIQGNYFLGDKETPLSVAFYGNQTAKIIEYDVNQIKVIVPSGSKAGEITVTSMYGSSRSNFQFRDKTGLITDFHSSSWGNPWGKGKSSTENGCDGMYESLL